jgi:hypothetical protein
MSARLRDRPPHRRLIGEQFADAGITALVTPARTAWVRTLAGGLALYALVSLATRNVHLVPSLLLLGALLIPVTFVVYERLSVTASVG